MSTNPEQTSTSDARAGIGGACFFAALALLLQLPIYNRSIVPMDEGHLASVALWLQKGKYLYLDLHTGIFPGIYYFTNFLFSVFGNDLVVTRWAEVATNISITLCLWLAGLRVMRPVFAAIAPLLYLAIIPVSFPVLAMFNYSSFSLALSMAAFLFLLRYLDMGTTRDALILGMLLACAVITKQNFGLFTFITCGIALLAGRSGSALEDRAVSKSLVPVAAGGIVVTAIVVGYFVATDTFMDLIYSTVIKLGGDQLDSYNNPIPPIFGPHPISDSKFIFLYSPPHVFNAMLHNEPVLGMHVTPAIHSAAIRLSYGIPLLVLFLGPILVALTWRGESTRQKRRTAISVLFALLFFLGIFPSAIWSHLAFVLPPTLLLGGLLIDRADRAIARFTGAGVFVWRGVWAIALLLVSIGGTQVSLDVKRWHPEPMGVPRASLYVSAGQAEIYRSAMRFIEECAPDGEAIFVAPYMPVVYFLADRMNPTRYDLTIPGDVDGNLIVVGLEQSRTRCIVYDPVMYPEFPPFHELFPEAALYIQRNYRYAAKIEGGGSSWRGLVRQTRRGKGEGGE